MRKVKFFAALCCTAMLFAACEKNEPTKTNNHDTQNDTQEAVDLGLPREAVDLGLPSGTLWATCNVGASTPSDYGNYYAWGETTSKESYDWASYKYGNDGLFTKYISDANFGKDGFTDGLYTLEAADDAATANWGNDWRTPSIVEWEELFNEKYCTQTWSNLNGVNGYEIKSKVNGNSIFIPASGFYEETSLDEVDTMGYYWTITCSRDSYIEDGEPSAHCIDFDSDYFWTPRYFEDLGDDRTYGLSVRPVKKIINTQTQTLDGHDYVDLGLQSGTLWATCNVGATAPEEYGNLYAWGDITIKETWETKYLGDEGCTKYCYDASMGKDGYTDTLTTLEASDDVATVNWGNNWRMPTAEELEELLNENNCAVAFTTQNRVDGVIIRSKTNGNSIFLPAAGFFLEPEDGVVGTGGCAWYWSSSLSSTNTEGALGMRFYRYSGDEDYDEESGVQMMARIYGSSVRPVLKK